MTALRAPQATESSGVLLVGFDEETSKNLESTLHECGLARVPHCSLQRTGIALAQRPVSVVLCPEERLSAVMQVVRASGSNARVVAVSRLEDWGHYFDAIRAGAFDYIVYPVRRFEMEWTLKKLIQPATATARPVPGPGRGPVASVAIGKR
jgi:DNA-binding NtrC family response regulator